MYHLIRLVVRIILTAVAVGLVLPLVPGFEFHGDLTTTIGFAVLISVTTWAISSLAGLLYMVVGTMTLGCGCLILFPIMLFQGFLVPLGGFLVMARIFPEQLTLTGAAALIFPSLVVWMINMLTYDYSETLRVLSSSSSSQKQS